LLQVTDEALIVQVTLGNRDAYQQLLSRQLSPMSHYVTRMMGHNADTEDILQEVFLRLWTHADRYKPEVAKVSTWLHSIAHHLCIDALLSRSHANSRVMQALTTLPERQRSAIILCHYQELSNKDAATILEVSVDALESLLARGRRNLKTRLDTP
jgi:RNA polymerase sigma-70 factor (ECF subfamily)